MSTIKLKGMGWDNTFSYAKNNYIDLHSNRVTQIVGINGSGKSSIPTTLEEGLYNKNSKGFKKAEIPNRHLGDPYSIELEFEVEGKEYSFLIQKASTLKAFLLQDGEDISAHTATGTFALVEDIMGMNFKIFSQLVYQNMDSSLQFLSATDAKRKEFLVELFDLSEYSEKQLHFTGVLKKANEDYKFLEGKVSTLESQISRYQKDADIEVKEDLIPVIEFPTELLEERAELELSLKNIKKDNQEREAKNRALQALSSVRNPADIQREIDAIELADVTNEIEEIGRLNSEIKQSKTVIEKMSGLAGLCHTCLQPIDPSLTAGLIEENTIIIEKNRAVASIIKQKIDTNSINMDKVKLKLIEKTKAERAYSAVSIKEPLPQIEEGDLSDSLSMLEKRITDANQAIKFANEHNARIQLLNAKRTAALDNLESINEELAEIKVTYLELRKKISLLEVLKKALSPTGLVAYKLENKVKDLEDATNKYLSRLSDGQFNLSFSLQKDKLNVVIYNDGNEVTMTTLSAGEHARVVIGTLLGIRRIMQSVSKTTVNVLFLDEVISVLDEVGKEQLVELLLEEKDLNTFLVSHGWTHPLVTKLEVIKEDGISKIYS